MINKFEKIIYVKKKGKNVLNLLNDCVFFIVVSGLYKFIIVL